MKARLDALSVVALVRGSAASSFELGIGDLVAEPKLGNRAGQPA